MRLLLSAVLFVGVVSLSACGGNENNNNPDAGTNSNALACQGNEPTVTAQQLFTDVISKPEAQCTVCHVPGVGTGTGGGLVMNTVETLKANTNKAISYSPVKVVDPNHPENSTMYLKVLGGSSVNPPVKGPHGESVGTIMPQGASNDPSSSVKPLTDAQVTEIKNWICSGAQ